MGCQSLYYLVVSEMRKSSPITRLSFKTDFAKNTSGVKNRNRLADSRKGSACSRPLSKAQNIAAAGGGRQKIHTRNTHASCVRCLCDAKSGPSRNHAGSIPRVGYSYSFHSLFTFIFISIPYAVGGILMNSNSQQF